MSANILMAHLEWKISNQRIDYLEALHFMEGRVREIIAKQSPELIWFLEHPSIYTAGTSAKKQDLLDARFPVYHTGRGGEFTYHGPGQLVIYLLLDLKKRCIQDIKRYIFNLEQVIINALYDYSIRSQRINGKVGVWIQHNNQYEKIAAIGIRIKKWVTYHGISLNINPNLNHYNGIIPCGISHYGMTSLAKLGYLITQEQIYSSLQKYIKNIFL